METRSAGAPEQRLGSTAVEVYGDKQGDQSLSRLAVAANHGGDSVYVIRFRIEGHRRTVGARRTASWTSFASWLPYIGRGGCRKSRVSGVLRAAADAARGAGGSACSKSGRGGQVVPDAGCIGDCCRQAGAASFCMPAKVDEQRELLAR